MKRDIGLVLDGGGGKGAYQLGVWKALRETGLEQRIAQISGTSVGGLNAALMVQGDLELAEKIWFEEIADLKPTRIHMWVSNIIQQYLDFGVFSRSEIECWLATTCTNHKTKHITCIEPTGDTIRKYRCGKAHYFNMRGCSEAERRKLLTEDVLDKNVMLATCALPLLCKSRKIDGLRYRDGGLADNSPARPLADIPQLWNQMQPCRYIIVIHLDPVRCDLDAELFANTTLLQIDPSTDTGGFLKGTIRFDPQNARRLATAGYYESLPLFRTLLANEKRENDAVQIQRLQERIYQQKAVRYPKALDRIRRIRKEYADE